MSENNYKDIKDFIIIDDTKYQTIIPKKFAEKKPYVAPKSKGVTAFIPGTIKKVFVSSGQQVKKGDSLMILEAMKMKNLIKADSDSTINKVYVKEGDRVPHRELLIDFK